jgi:hypothetical protein
MLFKPNTIVFIQRNGLLVAGRHLSPIRMEFPEDAVHNLEVANLNRLTSVCQQFFTDRELRGKRIQVILDYSVVFEKSIELDQSGKPDIIMEGFVAAMPFDQGKRACLAYQSGSTLRLFAVNAELYQAVVAAIDAADAGTVTAITPVAAYNLTNEQRTIRAAADFILKQTDTSKQVDFQSVVPT